MDDAVNVFLQNGILGAGIVVLGFALWKKDKQLADEKDKRLEDAKQQTERVTQAFEKRTEVDQMFLEKMESSKRGGR